MVRRNQNFDLIQVSIFDLIDAYSTCSCDVLVDELCENQISDNQNPNSEKNRTYISKNERNSVRYTLTEHMKLDGVYVWFGSVSGSCLVWFVSQVIMDTFMDLIAQEIEFELALRVS